MGRFSIKTVIVLLIMDCRDVASYVSTENRKAHTGMCSLHTI